MSGDGVKTDDATRAARKISPWAWVFSAQNAQTGSTITGLLGLVLGGVAVHYGLPPDVGIGVATGIATAVGTVSGALIAHNPNAAPQ